MCGPAYYTCGRSPSRFVQIGITISGVCPDSYHTRLNNFKGEYCTSVGGGAERLVIGGLVLNVQTLCRKRVNTGGASGGQGEYGAGVSQLVGGSNGYKAVCALISAVAIADVGLAGASTHALDAICAAGRINDTGIEDGLRSIVLFLREVLGSDLRAVSTNDLRCGCHREAEVGA